MNTTVAGIKLRRYSKPEALAFDNSNDTCPGSSSADLTIALSLRGYSYRPAVHAAPWQTTGKLDWGHAGGPGDMPCASSQRSGLPVGVL